MELKEQFEQAVAASKQLTIRPTNDTLLKIYSLYKQGTEGDNHAEQPGMFDFVAKAKYEAWHKLKGIPADVAMQQYIAIIDVLSTQKQ